MSFFFFSLLFLAALGLHCSTSFLFAAHGLICPAASRILASSPGIKPRSPALEGGFSTSRPPGETPCAFLPLSHPYPQRSHSMGCCHLRALEKAFLEHSWEPWNRPSGVDRNYRSQVQDESGWLEKLALQNPSQTEKAGADDQWHGACGPKEIIHPWKAGNAKHQWECGAAGTLKPCWWLWNLSPPLWKAASLY